MQPDTPEDKEKTKRKNSLGITKSYILKILGFLLIPPVLVGAFFLFIIVFRIRSEDMPVARFILPNVESVPMGLWTGFSLLWLVLWRKLFRRTKEGIFLFVVHALCFLAVAAVIFFYSLIFSRRLKDTIVAHNVEYALTVSFDSNLMLWVCPENLCYGQVIMYLDSGPYDATLEIIDNNILQVNTHYVIPCLPLQNLTEKIVSKELVLSRDSVDCPPTS